MFHARNGLFFQATGQGNVCIIKTNDGKEPYSRSFPYYSDKVETNIVCDVTLSKDEWASVVRSVSEGGETAQPVQPKWTCVAGQICKAGKFYAQTSPFNGDLREPELLRILNAHEPLVAALEKADQIIDGLISNGIARDEAIKFIARSGLAAAKGQG